MESELSAGYGLDMVLAILRAPVLAFVVGGAVSIFAYHELTDDPLLKARIEQLEQDKLKLEKRIYFLRERERVARVHVLDQQVDPTAPGGLRTTFRFEEIDADGHPVGPPQELTIDGDVLYVDAQVIKFNEEFLGENELEQGTSLLLFRRLFGEHQAPVDGFPLDSAPRAPYVYSAETAPDPFQEELWNNFWDYANNPEVMKRTGVRAMHGEAPYMRLETGRSYQIELRSSDGLSIRPFDSN